MIIREADENDIPLWSNFRTKLWPDTNDQHWGEINDYFQGCSVDIEVAFIIETQSRQPVGFLELNIRNFAEGSRKSAVPYIEAWYIDEPYQGQGYGSLLMEKAESWAKEKGFDEIASDTELDNTKSIAMHKHLGFFETERVVCFLKKIK